MEVLIQHAFPFLSWCCWAHQSALKMHKCVSAQGGIEIFLICLCCLWGCIFATGVLTIPTNLQYVNSIQWTAMGVVLYSGFEDVQVLMDGIRQIQYCHSNCTCLKLLCSILYCKHCSSKCGLYTKICQSCYIVPLYVHTKLW